MALHFNKYWYQFHLNPRLFTYLLTITKFRANFLNILLPYSKNFHFYRPIIIIIIISSSSSSGACGGATNRKVAGSIPGDVIGFFSFT